jgi:hypothetical protein
MASKTEDTCRHRAIRPAPTPECVGESIPCWDAKRRVWQALDLLQHQAQTSIYPSAVLQPAPSLPTTTVHARSRPRRRQAGR